MTEREALEALTLDAERLIRARSLGLTLSSTELARFNERVQDARAVLEQTAPRAHHHTQRGDPHVWTSPPNGRSTSYPPRSPST